MAKLESAAEVIAIIKSGKYDNAVNAKRGLGRTSLSPNEKAKVFKFIDDFFGSESTTKASSKGPHQGRRLTKKVSKKAGKKKAARRAPQDVEVEEIDSEEEETVDLGEETEEEETVTEVEPRKAGKKVARTKGVLAISPSEVRTVADVLQVVDSTVQGSVRVLTALKQANELSSSGDISKGVSLVKQSLEGAAQVLHSQVVMPLLNSNQSSDSAVAQRLEAVVAASAPNLPPDFTNFPPVQPLG